MGNRLSHLIKGMASFRQNEFSPDLLSSDNLSSFYSRNYINWCLGIPSILNKWSRYFKLRNGFTCKVWNITIRLDEESKYSDELTNTKVTFTINFRSIQYVVLKKKKRVSNSVHWKGLELMVKSVAKLLTLEYGLYHFL